MEVKRDGRGTRGEAELREGEDKGREKGGTKEWSEAVACSLLQSTPHLARVDAHHAEEEVPRDPQRQRHLGTRAQPASQPAVLPSVSCGSDKRGGPGDTHRGVHNGVHGAFNVRLENLNLPSTGKGVPQRARKGPGERSRGGGGWRVSACRGLFGRERLLDAEAGGRWFTLVSFLSQWAASQILPRGPFLARMIWE